MNHPPQTHFQCCPVRVSGATLLSYALLALVLLLPWWNLGPARPAWDEWDRAVFATFNGSMQTGTAWHFLWALTNSRFFDLVPAVMMGWLYWRYLNESNRTCFRSRFRFGVAMGIFGLLWQRFVIKEFFELERLSPSLVLPNPVAIEGVYPWLPAVKGASEFSFPGDHAAMLLFAALVIGHVAGWRKGALALAIAVFFALPRLFGGAHWFSDVVVGGGFSGFLGAAVFLAGAKILQTRRAPAHFGP